MANFLAILLQILSWLLIYETTPVLPNQFHSDVIHATTFGHDVGVDYVIMTSLMPDLSGGDSSCDWFCSFLLNQLSPSSSGLLEAFSDYKDELLGRAF